MPLILNVPTAKQIEYATMLLKQLGYDPNDYNLDQMTSTQVSDLIYELKDERGY